jgi:hypothetical protein
MSFGRALYYPHINLTNKNWVKHALLYYDNISRIVPTSVNPEDSEEIIKIKYETGFIDDHSPDRREISDTFGNFSRNLERIVEMDEFFHDRYFRDYHHHRRRYLEHYEHRRDFYRDLVSSTGTYLHVQKLDRRIKERLFAIGLAIQGRNEWEDWIKIDNEIGLLYMTYLAKSISKRQTMPIVTDLETSFSSSIYFEPSIFSDYKGEIEYKLGTLLISNFIPKNINNVPLDKIIEIRDKYKDERLGFYTSINELCEKLPEINEEEAIKSALEFHSKSIEREAKSLKKAYESQKIETVNSFLTISVPSTIASLSNFIPAEYKSIGVGAGLLFGIISSVNKVKKERRDLKMNPKSYLLNLQSELGSKNLLQRINDTVNGLRRW